MMFRRWRSLGRLSPGIGLLASATLFSSLNACGGSLYAVYASSASSRLEDARAAGAINTAPYEYYLAREHLKQASQEAARAEYGDALQLAKLAEQYAEQAANLARAAKAKLSP